MGSVKAHAFTVEQTQLAKLAKALGHPARVAILQHIVSQNECVCGDIVKALPLSQATVSQHLKELKNVGLIKGTIDGPRICYCIDKEAWGNSYQQLTGLFLSLDSKHFTENCC